MNRPYVGQYTASVAYADHEIAVTECERSIRVPAEEKSPPREANKDHPRVRDFYKKFPNWEKQRSLR